MKRNTDEVLESPAKNIYHKNTGIQTEQPCKKDLTLLIEKIITLKNARAWVSMFFT